MANGIFEDISGIYTEEPDLASSEQSAADMLAEQMRREEEALAAALPTQRAEAEMARQDWIERGSPKITAPVQIGAGQIMPTSAGFMYMGNAIAPPEGGTPLAAQRAMESAVLRQNAPEAGAAYEQLAGMGIQPPGGRYLGTMTGVMPPMGTPGELREESMARYYRGMEGGLTEPEALAKSGLKYLPQGQYRRDQFSPVIRNVQGSLVRYDPITGAAENITPPGVVRPSREPVSPLTTAKLDELKKVNSDILKTEADLNANPDPRGMPDYRSESLGILKGKKRQLEAELATQRVASVPTAAGRPGISAPSRGKLTEVQAREFMKAAKGNKAEARRMAVAAGYDPSR